MNCSTVILHCFVLLKKTPSRRWECADLWGQLVRRIWGMTADESVLQSSASVTRAVVRSEGVRTGRSQQGPAEVSSAAGWWVGCGGVTVMLITLLVLCCTSGAGAVRPAAHPPTDTKQIANRRACQNAGAWNTGWVGQFLAGRDYISCVEYYLTLLIPCKMPLEAIKNTKEVEI